MSRIILFTVILLCLLNIRTNQTYSKKVFKFNLSRSVKKSFRSRDNYYLYRSLITGRKRGVSKSMKENFKRLNLLHLMTPSGLHFSSLFILFFLIRRLFSRRKIDYLELFICLSVYLFLPGYYSLRRVALLRSLFIGNKFLKSFYSPIQIFLIFVFVDFFFGTYSSGVMSWLLSVLFLGVIFLFKNKNILNLSVNLALAQCLLLYIFKQKLFLLGIIISPIITWIFSLAYPLLFFNLPIIKNFNYSDFLIGYFSSLIEFSSNISSQFPSIEITIPILIALILLSKSRLYLSMTFFIFAYLSF